MSTNEQRLQARLFFSELRVKIKPIIKTHFTGLRAQTRMGAPLR